MGAALTALACGESTVQNESVTQAAALTTPSLAASPPVARCSNVTVRTSNTCSLPVSINGGSSDPDGDLVGCTQYPAGPYAVGNTVVTLTCTDQGGRSASCSGTVTVNDGVAPVVRVSPINQLVQCARGGSYSYLTGVTADDLCEGLLPSSSISWSGTVNMAQLTSFPVTYQARDSATNLSAPVTRTVTVVDTLPPLLSMIGPATMPLECGSAFTDPGAMATDTCLGVLTSSIVRTGTVNPNAVGNYPLVYTVSDGRNTPATQTRTVKVSDTRAPTLTLTGPLSLMTECGAPYVDPGGMGVDVCAGLLPVVAINPPDVRQARLLLRPLQGDGSLRERGHRRPGSRRDRGRHAAPHGAAQRPGRRVRGVWHAVRGSRRLRRRSVRGPRARHGPRSVNTQWPGTYALTYSASDGRGHFGSATRTVSVSDTLAPALELVGPDSLELECDGSPYVEPGAVASDACAGDLTPDHLHLQRSQSVPGGQLHRHLQRDGRRGEREHRPPASSPSAPAPRCLPVHLSDYTLFLQEDYTGGHDVEGKVAVGGNLSMTDFAMVPGCRTPRLPRRWWRAATCRCLAAASGATRGTGAATARTRPWSTRAAPWPGHAHRLRGPLRRAAAPVRRAGALPATGSTRRESWGGIFLTGTQPP